MHWNLPTTGCPDALEPHHHWIGTWWRGGGGGGGFQCLRTQWRGGGVHCIRTMHQDTQQWGDSNAPGHPVVKSHRHYPCHMAAILIVSRHAWATFGLHYHWQGLIPATTPATVSGSVQLPQQQAGCSDSSSRY